MTAARAITMLLVILALTAWFNETLFAGTMTLTIDFGGQCSAMTKTGNPTTAPVTLTIVSSGAQKTCGNYVIKPKSAGAVTLSTGIDSSNDTLTLKNMNITKAAGSWPDLHITIKGENKYESIPSAIPSGPPVGYRVAASGFFKRGITNNLATGSYIKTRGYQRNPTQTGTLFWIGSTPPSAQNGIQLNWTVCGTAGCSNVLPATYSTFSIWNSTLAATRDLRSEFWVKLNDKTDALNLTELKVFHYMAGIGSRPPVTNSTFPGCPPEQCVPCQENSTECEHEPNDQTLEMSGK